MTRFIRTECWDEPVAGIELTPILLNTAAVVVVTLPNDDDLSGVMALVTAGDGIEWKRLNLTWDEAIAAFAARSA